MTCGHSRTAITKAVGELDEVLAADVDVTAGLVTVTTNSPSDEAAIAAAVDDAGYELTGRA
ncbi:copper chaperone CopZ [Streptomyces candidus]|uniref:Copper chaperone CopZ n=2 Tax=Streptomyces candidus TaxID=67283 RepID=A0A7X0LTJ7_9ACTN|nr:copper chaperone CopZ [Streptomyces candidus]